MYTELESYEALVGESEKIKQILTPEMAAFAFGSNELTVGNLSEMWSANLRKNIKFYKKHGSLVDSFHGFGINKAVIAVGAGPSFNLNKDTLLDVYHQNLMFPYEEQPFILVATNKQFKPMIEMDIHPHFTILIDGGDALYPQLCEGIPDFAKKSILIAGLHTSPKIIEAWDKNGGEICFYLIGEDDDKEFFRKETGEDPDRVHIEQGANVTNTLWLISNRVLGSSVYMMVGNDLAFPYSKSLKERRSKFYADGDYSLHIENKHDDAREELGWMGLKDVHMSELAKNQLVYDLEPVGVSKTFWIYKIWMESQVAIWYEKHPFQIYNCSEAGIMGVLCRDTTKKGEKFRDKSNWYLMDELCPKAWRTRTLEEGVREFLEARFWLKQNVNQGILTGAGNVIERPDQMNIVKRVVQNEKERMTRFGITL